MVNLSKIKSEIEELKKQIKNSSKKKSVFERIEEYTKKFEEIEKSQRYSKYVRAMDLGDHILADQIISDLSSECQKLFKTNYYFDNLHKSNGMEIKKMTI